MPHRNQEIIIIILQYFRNIVKYVMILILFHIYFMVYGIGYTIYILNLNTILCNDVFHILEKKTLINVFER